MDDEIITKVEEGRIRSHPMAADVGVKACNAPAIHIETLTDISIS